MDDTRSVLNGNNKKEVLSDKLKHKRHRRYQYNKCMSTHLKDLVTKIGCDLDGEMRGEEGRR